MNKKNIEKTNYGYNITWIETEEYTSKILVFEAARAKIPVHFHKLTTKSWFVNSGSFKIAWIDTKDGQLYEKEFGEGTVFHVPPCTPCGLEAIVDNSSISQTSNLNDPADYFVLSS
jgi:mannose-6-phosphate isomerase-like protein (cupin superfamily)